MIDSTSPVFVSSVVTETINMVNLSPKIQKLIVEANTSKALNRERHCNTVPEDREEPRPALLE